jgi:hypothetical protein
MGRGLSGRDEPGGPARRDRTDSVDRELRCRALHEPWSGRSSGPHAKEEGRTLGVSDVPAWALNPAAHLFVEPRKPPRDWGSPSAGRIPIVEVPSTIDRVHLTSKGATASAPAAPDAFETADATFSESKWLVSQLPQQVGPDGRLQPMVFEKSRARATFSIESVKALPAGDVDVVIVTKDGERHCSIGVKDRSRLFR